ncbi:MAG: response regulator transcription factor [Acidimicrobiales bacterium]|nr:response regulator transcription factor [Acidimicrobiales bacterium]
MTVTTPSSPPTLVVIDDEPDLRRALEVLFGRAGFTVVTTVDGRAGLRAVHEHHPDLVLLDLGLPQMDGLDVLERIRDLSDVPVMVITARGLESDKVRGLQGGADDYVTKPFGNQELVARAHALLRRAAPTTTTPTTYDDGQLHVDFAAHLVRVTDGTEDLDLTPTEFRLLAALVRHPGQVLSPEQLLDQAWNDPTGIGGDRVKFAVHRLRGRLGWTGPGSPIEAVRGFGYRYRRA